MNNAETRRTGIALLAAIGLSFGSLTHAAGDSDKEGKRTLSRETTHGNESTIGNKRGPSGPGAQQSRPQGSSLGGSSTDKATNTDIGGGGKGSGAMLQGGVETNKQGTAGGASSMGGMKGTVGKDTGQGARSGAGSGSSTGSSGGSGN
jgi:hypothetical protein